MNSKALLSFALLIVSTVSFASNSSCPTKLAGKWFCHEQGMPGNGSDETTYHQTFQYNRDARGNISSFSTEVDGAASTEIPLDHKWHEQKIGPTPESGVIRDIEKNYFCADGNLRVELEDIIYKNAADYRNYKSENVYFTHLTYKMDNDDQYEVYGGQETDICTRE